MPSFSRPSSRACLTDGRLTRGKLAPLTDEPANLGQRSIAKGWDVLMKNARQQAETYVFLLDADHPAPPFIIVCDVGHCLELYADFTGTGRAYGQFPDRNGFRIYMDDLRQRRRPRASERIWQEPHSLDPVEGSRPRHPRHRQAPGAGEQGAGGARMHCGGRGAFSHALHLHHVRGGCRSFCPKARSRSC